MANIPKLREQARVHETREQWREAIAAYRQILENPEGGDVDIGLWNRVGDLHLRLNEQDRAVEAYESAVNAYVDVGLFNNAIALCRKILRLVPGRVSTYRRLGQISAAKGFFADARQNFLEYADRMRRAGQLDAAFEGLREFADLSPDDVEVRRILADQLLSHERPDDAVEQLRILLGILLGQGDEAAAEAVRVQIRRVSPDASTEPLARAARAADGDDFQSAFDAGFGDTPATAAPPEPEPAPRAVAGLEVSEDFSRPGPEAPAPRPAAAEPEPEAGSLPLMDFDAAADPSSYGEISLDDAPPAPVRRAPAEPGPAAGGELSLVDFGMELHGAPDEEDAGGEELPLLDFAPGSGADGEGAGAEDAGGEDAGGELPLLDLGTPAAPPPAPARDRLEALRERVAVQPGDHAARDELVDLLHARGLGEEALRVLEAAHRDLAGRGQWRDAITPVSQLIRLRPGDDGPLLQKRVEYAFRSGDRSALVEAYLALARHFDAGGDPDKARAVYLRVREIEPPNPEAREALAALAARAAVPPAAAPSAPSESEYVDLGALIMDDEDGAAGGTRFVVEEHEPSGDEDRDFADMLAHFRQKVAENIEVEDSASHYDLGVAFKEMGLLDEAIAEFQVALRGGASPLATLEMLGSCFTEKGQYAVATRVLERALRLPSSSDAELVGVLYALGRSFEALGSTAQATEYYERVLSVDIRFRDAQARLEALRVRGGAA